MRAGLLLAALALFALGGARAHVHSAPRLAAVAGAAPDATNASKATGVFFVDIDAPQAAWNLTLKGISAADLLAPSLHQATANTTVGPEVVPLPINATETRTSADGTLVVGGELTAASYVGPLKGRPFDIIHAHIHESEIYVVVPTKAYPAGEIKGKISPVMLSDD